MVRKVGQASYERLPNLCYWCGRLTHHDKGCSIWLNRKGTLRDSDQQFGSWLRAVTPNLAKKTVVRVAGYEAEVREDNRDATGQARKEEEGSEARTDELNHSELSEPDEQQPRVVHAGLEDAMNPEKSTSVGILSAQVGGFVSQDFQAKLDEIDVALGCFETSKVTGLDEWDNRGWSGKD